MGHTPHRSLSRTSPLLSTPTSHSLVPHSISHRNRFAFAILPLPHNFHNFPFRISDIVPLARYHTALVLATDRSPFDDFIHVLATTTGDHTVELQDLGDPENAKSAMDEYGDAIQSLAFNMDTLANVERERLNQRRYSPREIQHTLTRRCKKVRLLITRAESVHYWCTLRRGWTVSRCVTVFCLYRGTNYRSPCSLYGFTPSVTTPMSLIHRHSNPFAWRVYNPTTQQTIYTHDPKLSLPLVTRRASIPHTHSSLGHNPPTFTLLSSHSSRRSHATSSPLSACEFASSVVSRSPNRFTFYMARCSPTRRR